jgi:hypothetical protein
LKNSANTISAGYAMMIKPRRIISLRENVILKMIFPKEIGFLLKAEDLFL